MFDIGATELLIIIIVAVLVIGPKDMPRAMRTAGRWIGKVRKVSGHFRAGIESMIREAEMEEMEKKWAEQNKKIMAEHPADAPPEMEPTGAYPSRPNKPAGEDEGAAAESRAEEAAKPADGQEPELPLGKRD